MFIPMPSPFSRFLLALLDCLFFKKVLYFFSQHEKLAMSYGEPSLSPNHQYLPFLPSLFLEDTKTYTVISRAKEVPNHWLKPYLHRFSKHMPPPLFLPHQSGCSSEMLNSATCYFTLQRVCTFCSAMLPCFSFPLKTCKILEKVKIRSWQ